MTTASKYSLLYLVVIAQLLSLPTLVGISLTSLYFLRDSLFFSHFVILLGVAFFARLVWQQHVENCQRQLIKEKYSRGSKIRWRVYNEKHEILGVIEQSDISTAKFAVKTSWQTLALQALNGLLVAASLSLIVLCTLPVSFLLWSAVTSPDSILDVTLLELANSVDFLYIASFIGTATLLTFMMYAYFGHPLPFYRNYLRRHFQNTLVRKLPSLSHTTRFYMERV
ncbi:MAG: hypothetical protein AAGB12_12330 [Pseudomonadota bacterium]